MSMEKVAVVTGSSSGIGFQTSILLARSGYATYATMRDMGKSGPLREIANSQKLPLTITKLDVTNEDSVSKAIQFIIKKLFLASHLL